MKLKRLQEETYEPQPIFTRGYHDVRERVINGSRYTMSCYNCEFFYQAPGDREEVCQNPEVLQYDMVIQDNTIYCNRWELTHRGASMKGIFKKGVKRK